MEYRYSLRGNIDIANAPQLRSDLQRATSSDGVHLLVDCTHLIFIDSTGIAVLLEAHAALEADGRHMLLLNVNGSPRRALDALGLTDLFRYDRLGAFPSAEVKHAASIVSVQTSCPIEEALAYMCERADELGSSLSDLATAVIDGSMRFDRPDKTA